MFWTIAQIDNRETEPEGLGWDLYENFLIALDKFEPDFFLYENNKSASPAIKEQIAKTLGVELMHINSALVSAQNRERFYGFNWNVAQPEDRGILLQDVIESGVVNRDKAYCLKHQAGCERDYFKKRHTQIVFEPVLPGEQQNKRIYEVDGGFIEYQGARYPLRIADGLYTVRPLTVKERCRLQTLPDDYCRAISATQAYKALGNGWTADVIIHILSGALADVPKDEEIVVLSMYDGIATGRYCLEKMGFSNVKYYAYEKDKHAIKAAMSNYPDIVQMGDAFDVRRADWSIGNLRSC